MSPFFVKRIKPSESLSSRPILKILNGRLTKFIFGLVLIGYGIGLYVSADLGSGPRDSMMIMMAEKTGWSIQWVRSGMELFVLILGWMLECYYKHRHPPILGSLGVKAPF